MQKLSPKLYCFINSFILTDLLRLSNNINLIYRNYNNPINIDEIRKLKSFCKQRNIKVFISNDMKLAINLKFDGIYIPSFNKICNFGNINNKPNNFQIIGSAHNFKEIITKERQGCEEIFISPIFKVEKSKSFLNTIKFNLLANKTNRKVIALGGINENNFNNLRSTNCIGFASISWAKKNGLRKLRPF